MAQESWKRDQDETGCQHPEGPILCINKCGFFGSPATMNMCSKCYRDVVAKDSGAFTANVLSEKAIKDVLGDTSLVLSSEIEKNCMPMLNDSTMDIVETIVGQDIKHPVAEQPAPSTVAQDELTSPMLNDSTMDLVETIVGQDIKHPVSEQPAPSTVAQDELTSPLVNRCFACKKRVGLTGFKCRCGDLFCPKHRYSDKHDCSFDYKAAGKAAIAKANPLVKAGKLEKI